MARSSNNGSFYSVPHARWVIGVLNMLIAVVGREGLLGLILRRTRSEVAGIVRDEKPHAAKAKAACYKNN
jgi:hypothetical protein